MLRGGLNLKKKQILSGIWFIFQYLRGRKHCGVNRSSAAGGAGGAGESEWAKVRRSMYTQIEGQHHAPGPNQACLSVAGYSTEYLGGGSGEPANEVDDGGGRRRWELDVKGRPAKRAGASRKRRSDRR